MILHTPFNKQIAVLFFFIATSVFAKAQTGEIYKPAPYVPDDKALYDTIVKVDSIYFSGYNFSNMKILDRMTSDSFEFYHDRTGPSFSKADYLKALQQNIFGKVSRILEKNSIEVYPIGKWGAVEIGYHRFQNHQEGDHLSRPGKFIVIWQNTADGWKLKRVVSLH